MEANRLVFITFLEDSRKAKMYKHDGTLCPLCYSLLCRRSLESYWTDRIDHLPRPMIHTVAVLEALLACCGLILILNGSLPCMFTYNRFEWPGAAAAHGHGCRCPPGSRVPPHRRAQARHRQRHRYTYII
jgi:hypothetical protein